MHPQPKKKKERENLKENKNLGYVNALYISHTLMHFFCIELYSLLKYYHHANCISRIHWILGGYNDF